MKLTITDCPDKKFEQYVIEAMEFYAKELIPNTRIRNNCDVEVVFKDDDDFKVLAYASIVDYNTARRPRYFLIEMNARIGARQILSSLAHEMVHIKQYVFGETDSQLSVWKGEPVDSESLDYWIHPWEIEAYGREPGLLDKLNRENKLYEIFQEFGHPDSPIECKPILWKNDL